jgi:hypothetical protein
VGWLRFGLWRFSALSIIYLGEGLAFRECRMVIFSVYLCSCVMAWVCLFVAHRREVAVVNSVYKPHLVVTIWNTTQHQKPSTIKLSRLKKG